MTAATTTRHLPSFAVRLCNARQLLPLRLLLRQSLLIGSVCSRDLYGSAPPHLARSSSSSSSNSSSSRTGSGSADITSIPVERIRNFAISAHIDHGKSSLSDRLLELTGTIDKSSANKQVLDKLKVEKERGITVKAQSASMLYTSPTDGQQYLLNLIDTPGHVDFASEVTRSMAACQGTVLLVDAAKGVQAQTVANFYHAFSANLAVIACINKIDLSTAEPDRVEQQIAATFEIDVERERPLRISAKTGINIESVLEAVIERIPPPPANPDKPFRSLLFDSWHDKYVGVICLVAISDGCVKRGDKIASVHTGLKYEVTEVGMMRPNPEPTAQISAGQVGYIVCNMKSIAEAHIGDTFHLHKQPVEPFPGFAAAKPVVYAGVYPVDSDDYPHLDESIKRLTLNDVSVQVQKETSMALGQGWRLGFLGTLHMDVFRQRLEDEYEADVIITHPTVPYRILYRNKDKTYSYKTIQTPADFPEPQEMHNRVSRVEEPMVNGTIIVPNEYLGSMMELCSKNRGVHNGFTYIDDTRVMIKCALPLAEIVVDFYDHLKSLSSGYASFDYEPAQFPVSEEELASLNSNSNSSASGTKGSSKKTKPISSGNSIEKQQQQQPKFTNYAESDLTKLTVMLNGRPVDALSLVTHSSKAEFVGRDLAQRLAKVIKRQLFEVNIQTYANGRVVAKERIPPLRKDVCAKCYGGDPTRRMKLLSRQREGKKRMKAIGNVEVPNEAFASLISK
ncbi:translation factor GUF1, mitochondrial [Ramicandelaber brevisporus]|nr:translation factor GUF1, mitochondrial [Ramicandelaber brevisporus]